ncbi:MAG: Ig-like domain-containing protein, partial [Pseudomonadota bacterium]
MRVLIAVVLVGLAKVCGMVAGSGGTWAAKREVRSWVTMPFARVAVCLAVLVSGTHQAMAFDDTNSFSEVLLPGTGDGISQCRLSAQNTEETTAFFTGQTSLISLSIGLDAIDDTGYSSDINNSVRFDEGIIGIDFTDGCNVSNVIFLTTLDLNGSRATASLIALRVVYKGQDGTFYEANATISGQTNTTASVTVASIVQQPALEVLIGGVLTTSGSSQTLRSIEADGARDSVRVIIRNPLSAGSANLTASNFIVSAESNVAVDDLSVGGLTFPVGTGRSFDIFYTSQEAGPFGFTLSFNTNLPGQDPFIVNLTGSALDSVKPVLAQVTAVPSPTTPASARPFVFTSSEAGTIGISGSPLGCTIPPSTPAAVAGTNTVNLGGILFSGVDTTTSGCAITVTDAFGNVSDPLTIPAFIIDDTVPSVAISGAPTLATAPYEVTITYSEPIAITGNPGVADISNVGVTVTNGDYTGKAATQGNLSPTVLGVLTATGIIKPTNDGPVTVVVNAGAGTDRVGTANQASSTVTTIFDAVPPTATISGNPAEASDPFEVVIGFSEPVLGFEDSDVLVGNGSFTRTFTSLDVTGTGGVDGVRGLITPTADGDVTVSVPADAVEDKANRNNPASNTVTTVFNAGPPSAVLSSGAANVGLNPVSVMIGFSEDVTGFTLSDLSLAGLEASNLQTTDAKTFTFDVVATTDGTGQITLPAGAAQDLVGLASVASDTFSLPVRASRPVFTLDSVVPRATGQVANFAISPSGSGVGGVTPTSAIDITGGVITSIFTGLFGGAPLGVQIIFEPTGGPVTISLPEDFRFEGEFGNGTAATGPVSIGTFTNTTTIVQISDLSGPDSGPLTATITLSEASTEFDVGDLFIENATAVLSGAGDTYTVVLTPVADGRVRLAVGANRFFSTSGKPNIASNFVSRMVDATPPTVSIGALSGPTD